MRAILLVGLLACAAAAPGAQVQPTPLVGTAEVIDGDGLIVAGRELRLSGIDAPECGVRCADGVHPHMRASLALAAHLDGGAVVCAVNGVDRYQRAVATCTLDSADVGAWMVEQGWARDWPRYSGRRYAAAEANARAAGRGVWTIPGCDDLWSGRTYE